MQVYIPANQKSEDIVSWLFAEHDFKSIGYILWASTANRKHPLREVSVFVETFSAKFTITHIPDKIFLGISPYFPIRIKLSCMLYLIVFPFNIITLGPNSCIGESIFSNEIQFQDYIGNILWKINWWFQIQIISISNEFLNQILILHESLLIFKSKTSYLFWHLICPPLEFGYLLATNG